MCLSLCCNQHHMPYIRFPFAGFQSAPYFRCRFTCRKQLDPRWVTGLNPGILTGKPRRTNGTYSVVWAVRPQCNTYDASNLCHTPWLGCPARATADIRGYASTTEGFPLILSPSLPPIPGKVVERIKNGENPDLKDMLSDNIALAKCLHEAHWPTKHIPLCSKFREVTDPLSWVFCFSNVKSEDRTRKQGRWSHMQIMLDLVRKHRVAGLRHSLPSSIVRRRLVQMEQGQPRHWWPQQYWGTHSSGKAPNPAPRVW